MATKPPKSPSKKTPKNRDEPQTMEQLLTQTDYQLRGFKRGEEVGGKITGILPKAVFVDIGGKTEGVVAGREYEAVKAFLKKLKVGDKVTAIVVSPETDQGQILLSLRRLASSTSWERIASAYKKGEELEAEITGKTQAGFLIQIEGLSGFIPASQMGAKLLGKKRSLVGEKIKVKVVEVDKTQNRLICSERLVSEKEKIEKTLKALKKAKIGEILEGEITGVVPFGLFVRTKLGKEEVEGLVHISEISWEKVEDPASFYKVGDKAKVKIIGIDEESQKLALSVKQLKPDPWAKAVKKYPVESKVSGEVAKLAPYGAFVEIEPGVEGLVHISKIPPEQKINVGDWLDFFVEAVDEEKRRLSLSLVLKGKPVGYK